MRKLRPLLNLPATQDQELAVASGVTIGQIRTVAKSTRAGRAGPLTVTTISSGRVIYSRGCSYSGQNVTRTIRCMPHLFANDDYWEIKLSYPEDKRYLLSEDAQESPEWRHNNAWFDDSPITLTVNSSEGLSQFRSDISSFIEQFESDKISLGPPRLWHRIGARITVLCDCGHEVAMDRSHQLYQCDDVFERERNLACSACGVRGMAKVIPTMMDDFFTPDQNGYRGVGSRKPARLLNKPHQARVQPDVDHMYDAVGGDGLSDAYLSDGLYIKPDGTIY